MILSPYRNPPYRSPTPQTSTSPPPPSGPGHPSPKRKRSDSGALPEEILRLETANLRDEASEPVSGCDSPRSKVAEKFRDLDLDRLRLEKSDDGDGGGGEGVQRKRLKRNPPVRGLVSSPVKEMVVAETPEARSRPGTALREEVVDEIQETPQVPRADSPSPPEPPEDGLQNLRRNCKIIAQTTQEANLPDRSPSSTPLPPSPRVLVSPPPAPSSSPITTTQPPIPDRALSPLPTHLSTTKDPSPTPEIDRASLTWQDSEITGHEIDSLLGDDGLGINGIGFRPTPAMAYARAQKRKAQVSEWKAREAREARQRRMERRRGAEVGGGEVGGGVGERRVVRFEVEGAG